MTVNTLRVMPYSMPCREQVDRDLLEDNRGDSDYHAVAGPHPVDVTEGVAS